MCADGSDSANFKRLIALLLRLSAPIKSSEATDPRGGAFMFMHSAVDSTNPTAA